MPVSKQMVFFLLMAGSALTLAVPNSLVHRPAGEMTQLIAYPQWAVHQAAIKATEPLKALARQQLTADQQARLQEQNKGLENENAVLRQQLVSLHQTVQELTYLRRNDHDTHRTILPAEVIAGDAAPRQDSFLVSQGRARGVKFKDWVATRLFVHAGQKDGVQADAAVLSQECLIGWVEQAATFTSRVVLLSDPVANRGMRVHLTHFDPETRQLRDVLLDERLAEFVLRGAGDGKMIVRDVSSDFLEAGVVAVGDLVSSDPRDARLGQSLVIGEIEQLRHNKEQPLLYDLIVRHRFDPTALAQVLIVP